MPILFRVAIEEGGASVKIIEPGLDPQNRIFEGSCVSCHCLFQFERREAIRQQSTSRNETFLLIACPTCKREVWVQI
jgi:hypothetical protein